VAGALRQAAAAAGMKAPGHVVFHRSGPGPGVGAMARKADGSAGRALPAQDTLNFSTMSLP